METKQEFIIRINKSIVENEELLNSLFEDKINSLNLIAELDIIQTYKISLLEYESLKNASQDINIKEEDLQQIIFILNIIEDKIKMIKLINDKVIMSGKKIDKNLMSYILKNNNNEKPQTPVININIDENGEPLTLNKILGEGNE